MEMLLAVITGWFVTFVSVALGGWLVFRTKREQYDSLFSTGKQPEADVFNVDDFSDMTGEQVAEKVSQPEFESGIMKEAQNRFQEQFNESAKVNSVVDKAVEAEKQR